MNGIGLLVLIAAAGQITAAQPSGQNRDFGWERDTQNPDKALCYIIQLSPENVAEMQGKAIEKRSDMPPELVGRATRILVRIGTDILPQSPSLEELRNMPRFNSPADVTAQLGGGRLSDVDPSDLQNVQQRGSNPPLPSFPGPSSANAQSAGTPPFSGNPQFSGNQGAAPAASGSAMPRSNLSDSASQDSDNPIDQAKQLDNRTPAFPNPRTNTPGNISGTTPTLPNNAGEWRTPTIDDSQRSRDEVSRTADNRFQNQGVGNYPQSNYPQSTMPPGYESRTPPSLDPSTMTSIPNRPTPNIGFGTQPNGQNQGKFGLSTPGFDNFSGQGGQVGQGNQFGPNAPYNQGYGSSQYANGQYGSGQYGSGQFGSGQSGSGQRPNGQNGFDGRELIASNTTLPPLNSSTLPPQQPPTKGSAGETSPGDTSNSTLTSTSSPRTSENILSVFFLFSLVVNFYLGMLIRKLLTRYRALLANMRGQASPNAFSS